MPIPTHPFQNELIQAVNKVTPSVVSVSTVTLFRNYYRVHPVSGMGSGVVIDSAGHVVTNRHVIHRAQRLSLADSKGSRYEATLLGADQLIDVAVLRINSSDIPPADLGDSDKLQVGQLAIAIGNPYGFILGGPTVTTGVISAVNRQIQSQDLLMDKLIQTDASINPGNSGGPLCNIDGQVIGINTATIPFAQGIGFAIPINSVMDISEEIIKHGRVRRAYMGFIGMPLNPQIARNYRLSIEKGVIVARVMPNSPAESAGLREGDIIVAFDDKPIVNMAEIQSELRNREVGSNLIVNVLRNDRHIRLQFRLGEVPS